MSALPDRADPPAAGASLVAGWYGKMPCLGDFASRRLPAEFIEPWDHWLQRSIAESRRQLGEKWLEVFLRSPMWRFALGPGVCGADAWAGLLLPSVDKVGRYFPLTLALLLRGPEPDVTQVFEAHSWYSALEKIGLAALTVEFSPDQLELALADNPFPRIDAMTKSHADVGDMIGWLDTPAPPPQALYFSSVNELEAAVDATAHTLYSHRTSGRTFWWSVAPESGAIEKHCCNGLPPDDYFSVLLGGSAMLTATSDPLQAFGISQPTDDAEQLR